MSDGLILRFAGESDLCAIGGLDRLNGNALQNCVREGRVLVAEAGVVIAGVLRFSYFWEEIPFMDFLFVREDFRSQGIGKRLLNFYHRTLQNKGHKTAMTSTLQCESAQHFYVKAGYKAIGGFETEDGYELMFEKRL